jgi:peptide/nickel transport system permease protein
VSAREGSVGEQPGFGFSAAPEETIEGTGGLGPWQLTWRRLRRNRVALAAAALFIFLVAACLAAPLWAEHVAHTTPEKNHLTDQVEVDGKQVDVVDDLGQPIGPTWRGEFFLGADTNGRDVMVRLLYGGRNSLLIGITAAFLTIIFGTIVGLLSGYYRGWVDGVFSRFMDVLWAFPVILLGVAIGTAAAISEASAKGGGGGLSFGLFTLHSGSLSIPIVIIAIVYIPYLARPIRGQVLSLREKEFIEAARSQGMGSLRIIFREVMPNVASTMVVFFPLLIANAILLESALSFLGAGVQPPDSSWGTMIDEGVERIISAPHLAVSAGVMLVLTVLALNIFGEGVRDALDPRSKVKVD